MYETIKAKFKEEVFGKILLHRYLTRFGNSFLSGFTAVYTYITSGEQIWVPICVFLFSRFLSMIILFFSNFIFNIWGTKLSIIYGALLRIGLWVTLIFTNENNWEITFPIYTVILAFVVSVYWPPYNNIFNINLSKENRTQIIGFNRSFSNALGIFMPTIVGMIISFYSFNLTFIIGLFFLVISLYPIFKIPQQKHINFSWTPKDVFDNLISKKNFRFVFTIFSQGFERAFSGFLWPLVVYILLEGDLVSFGIVASVASFLVIILNVVVGKYSDKLQKGPMILKVSSSFQSIIYFLKIFAQTASDIFLLRSFSQVSSSVVSLSTDSMIFQKAAADKDLADEYIVLREIALSLGRVIAFSLILSLSFVLELQTLFLFAAVSVLFINILTFVKKG